ncbi:uncharacterized protein METZ01_LOCUS385187, partial [marine metagenome]
VDRNWLMGPLSYFQIIAASTIVFVGLSNIDSLPNFNNNISPERSVLPSSLYWGTGYTTCRTDNQAKRCIVVQ